MNGGTARRGAEKLGSDHLVPNIEVFRTNCSANKRDYHYTPLKQGVFFLKKVMKAQLKRSFFVRANLIQFVRYCLN